MAKYTGKRVRRNMALAERLEFYSIPEPNSGCQLWLASLNLCTDGYGQLFWEGRLQGAHILSWELANNRKVPAGLFVCHKCDVQSCINPAHLFLGTQKQNLADMIAKGRSPRGPARPNTKLTEEAVRAIRASKEVRHVLAVRYGVSVASVSRVRRGVRWTHVV